MAQRDEPRYPGDWDVIVVDGQIETQPSILTVLGTKKQKKKLSGPQPIAGVTGEELADQLVGDKVLSDDMIEAIVESEVDE
jgi:hypothetical protein